MPKVKAEIAFNSGAGNKDFYVDNAQLSADNSPSSMEPERAFTSADTQCSKREA